MILDIAHLCYNTLDFEKASSELNQQGFVLEFRENNLPNIRSKRKLLKHWNETHDLALFKKPGNFSIELLNHGYSTKLPGCIKLPFEKDLDTSNISSLVGLIGVTLNKIIFASLDSEGLSNLFKKLGFVSSNDDAGNRIMDFTSIFSQEKYSLLINNLGTRSDYTLDDAGFTSLTLLSNSAEKERLNLVESGYQVSDIQELIVNQKSLQILFVRAPGGEIIEIFSLK